MMNKIESGIEHHIPELTNLWNISLGDPTIKVAIIDGLIDLDHPAFKKSNLEISHFSDHNNSTIQNETLIHTTHVASIIFGQHSSEIKGIAPHCTGIVFPIFRRAANGDKIPCTQIDLARAITQALEWGANIINVSGGEISNSTDSIPILEKVLYQCNDENVLLVSSVGNNGCPCLNIPSANKTVLAVGSMNSKGQPLDFSNWHQSYQNNGILAPGENILGAFPGGSSILKTGTSFSTAIVSGLIALFLSIQKKYNQQIDPKGLAQLILDEVISCDEKINENCSRYLRGRLNISNLTSIIKSNKTMKENKTKENIEIEKQREKVIADNNTSSPKLEPSSYDSTYQSDGIIEAEQSSKESNLLQQQEVTSNCGCKKGSTCSCRETSTTQLVFAIGSLSYEYHSEASRDSIFQHAGSDSMNPEDLINYLTENPWEAASLKWTLNLDATPIYAIHPVGAFAAEVYQRLRGFLKDQLNNKSDLISIGGIITDQTMIQSGNSVPVVRPNMRCLYNWKTEALVEEVLGKPPKGKAKKSDLETYESQQYSLTNFLQRIYHELKNLGISSHDRALNYAATNALNAAGIFSQALKDSMQLDEIEVEKSSICRLGSDCWDVKLIFFDPENQFQRARKVFRFTVDVSDTCPVMVNEVRSWTIR